MPPDVLLDLPVGPAKAVASIKNDHRGNICMSIGFSRGGVTNGRAGSDCWPRTQIARAVRRRGAMYAVSVQRHDDRLSFGFARADLERVVVDKRRAGFGKTISGPWPREPTAKAKFRFFLVRFGGANPLHRAIALFRDGSRLPITGPPGGRPPRSTPTR